MNRVMTTINVILLVGIMITTGKLLQAQDDNLLMKVQTGKSTLECFFKKDGWRFVDADKVEGYVGNVWLFEKDGYAKQCKVRSVK